MYVCHGPHMEVREVFVGDSSVHMGATMKLRSPRLAALPL